jgi:DNA polymerase III subunit delta'
VSLPPWQQQAWAKLTESVRLGRLGHALLLAGPVRLGKRAFAERVAALLLCKQRGSQPCGCCRSCRLFAARTQRDPAEMRPDGSWVHPDGHSGHPDVRFVGYIFNEKTKKMHTELTVDQIRDLSGWLALTPRQGGALVASLILPTR